MQGNISNQSNLVKEVKESITDFATQNLCNDSDNKDGQNLDSTNDTKKSHAKHREVSINNVGGLRDSGCNKHRLDSNDALQGEKPSLENNKEDNKANIDSKNDISPSHYNTDTMNSSSFVNMDFIDFPSLAEGLGDR